MTVLLAFTLDHASRVTGLTEDRIRYWDETKVLVPSLSRKSRGGAYERIYSFRDLVGLRTVAALRDDFRVSLQSLREIGQRLQDQFAAPWSELGFYVSDGHLFYRDPETHMMLSAVVPGQLALVASLNLETVARDTDERAKQLVERSHDEFGEIVTNRYVFGNQPVVAGTRIPTRAIWEFAEAGYPVEDILREYPRLSPIDVRNAIDFEVHGRQRRLTG
jgi:uncharacterized protein (DUF433 family)